MKPFIIVVVILFTVFSQFAVVSRAAAEGYLLIDWRVKSDTIDDDFGRIYSHLTMTNRGIDWNIIIQTAEEKAGCNNFFCTATVKISSINTRIDSIGRLHITHAVPNPRINKLFDLYPGARERITGIVKRLQKITEGVTFDFTPRGGALHIKKQDTTKNTRELNLIRTDLRSAENAIYFSTIVETVFAPDPGFCIIEQVLNIRNTEAKSKDQHKLMSAVEFVGYFYRTGIAAYHHDRRTKAMPYDAALASSAAVEQSRAIGNLLEYGMRKLTTAYKHGGQKMSDNELITRIATSNLEQEIVKEHREQLLATIHLGPRYWAKFPAVLSRDSDATLQLCRDVLLPDNQN